MTRLFDLGERLKYIASLVPKGAKVADIGTDHARLPVWLLRHGIVSSMIATDINNGPIEKARHNAELHGVSDNLRLIRCDGLTAISPNDADTIIIAGMGGETIAKILSKALWTSDACCRLILQPMTNAHVLRRFLYDNGYEIISEHAIREGQRLYSVILSHGGHEKYTGLLYERISEKLLKTNGPERDEYLRKQIKNVQNELKGKPDNKRLSILKKTLEELL